MWLTRIKSFYPRIRRMGETLLSVIVGLTILAIVLALIDLAKGGPINAVKWWLVAPAAFLTATLAAIATRRHHKKAQHREEALQELHEAERALKGADQIKLVELWTITQSRLNYYHELATAHAQQSFHNAQIATSAGFLLLLAFAVLAVEAPDPQATFVAGALGAISAALAGYLGRTFIRSQESAASHLHTYFDQPVKFSRYLAAERLITSMAKLEPDQRDAISGELLRTIIAPDQAPSGTSREPDNGSRRMGWFRLHARHR
jgi:O-antigen/teichoic acid export membrane protein